MSAYSINLHGLRLEVEVTYSYDVKSAANLYNVDSDYDARGDRELGWHFTSGTDEIGEKLSFRSLDFIAKEYESEIEAAIWKRIEEERNETD